MTTFRPRRKPALVLCLCGSELPSTWRYDARGIALMRACTKCWPKKKLQYRPDVLTDPNYPTTEPVEPEE